MMNMMNNKRILIIILILLLVSFVSASRNNYVIIDTPIFGFSATIINGSNATNNYVNNSLFTRSGSVVTLTLERIGLPNLTSNFTDQTGGGGGKWSIDDVTLKNDSGVLTGNYTNTDNFLTILLNLIGINITKFNEIFYFKNETYNKSEVYNKTEIDNKGFVNESNGTINPTANILMSSFNISADWIHAKSNWSNNENYPSSCVGSGSSQTYVTSVNDTLTCDGISNLNSSNIQDVYLFNTGDTATGNYSFDSGTLFIDATNGGVGIGTANPRTQLEVMNGALYLSNTSVAHGVTDVIPTDVYGNFEIINANGGIKIRGFSQTGLAFFQLAYVNTSYTTESIGSLGAIGYSIYKKDGTAGGYMDDDDNLVVFRNAINTTHIFKGNGDLYAFGGISRKAHFWGVRTTEYNTVNTNFNILTYDNVYLSDSDFFSESSGTITIQRSGWYEASANCQSDLDGGTREDAQCAIYVNSAQLHECGMYAREIGVLGTGCTESVMLNLTATDTVSVRFRGGATDVDCGDGSVDCMTFRMEYVRDN